MKIPLKIAFVRFLKNHSESAKNEYDTLPDFEYHDEMDSYLCSKRYPQNFPC